MRQHDGGRTPDKLPTCCAARAGDLGTNPVVRSCASFRLTDAGPLHLRCRKDKFICTVCGQRNADIPPDWQIAVQG